MRMVKPSALVVLGGLVILSYVFARGGRGSESTEHREADRVSAACPRIPDGRWFARSGTIDVSSGGEWRFVTSRTTVVGVWRLRENHLVLSDKSIVGAGVKCREEQQGVYRLDWARDACVLTLHAENDSCDARQQMLHQARLARFRPVSASSLNAR